MPVDLTRARAKISGYGPNRNNDALNALVHVLATKMNDVPNPDHDRDATRRLLCNTFSEEWGTKLDWNQLTAVLRETHDPLHKEMLLGPALRRMLPEEERVGSAEISPESVAKLARKFNIRV